MASLTSTTSCRIRRTPTSCFRRSTAATASIPARAATTKWADQCGSDSSNEWCRRVVNSGTLMRVMSDMFRLRASSAALSAFALLTLFPPGQSVHAQDAAKGGMLLAEGRKALGGDDKLAAIKRLQVSGTFLRSTGPDQVIDGDFDVFIELPDKYRRDEITGFAGANAERTEVLNGVDVWDESSGGLTGGRGFGGGGGFPRGGRGGGGDRGGGGGFR